MIKHLKKGAFWSFVIFMAFAFLTLAVDWSIKFWAYKKLPLDLAQPQGTPAEELKKADALPAASDGCCSIQVYIPGMEIG